MLVPLSSVLAGATSHLPPHITAALQSLAPGGSAPSQHADPPLPPVPTEPTTSQLFQHAAVSQLLQQATAVAAAQPQSHQASGSHMQPVATSAWPVTAVAGPAASVAPSGASLAALVPHVPQVVPHVHPAVAAAIAAAAASKSEATAPSAGDWLLALSDTHSCAMPSRYSLDTSPSSSAGMYRSCMITG